MRILVTGREGQLARSLAAVGVGRELIFVGRPDFDLRDHAGVSRLINVVRPDVIVNAAAYTAVDAAEDDPVTVMAVNGEGPGAVAHAAARNGARLIQLSTDYVFDGRQARAYREDDPPSPLGVYGRTKLAGEQAVAAMRADAVILRTAWVYGPFGKNFVKTMLRLADGAREISVVADQTGSPTSSLDLASAIFRLIDQWRLQRTFGHAEIFHGAGSGATTWAGLADEVLSVRARLTGLTTTVRELVSEDYPTKAPRPPSSVLNCDKLAGVLNWRLPVWSTSVASTVARLLDAGSTNQSGL